MNKNKKTTESEEEDLNNKNYKIVDEEEIWEMSFLGIISNGRTKLISKAMKLLLLAIDMILLLFVGFAITFFYMGSNVGWIFIFLSIVRYITRK